MPKKTKQKLTRVNFTLDRYLKISSKEMNDKFNDLKKWLKPHNDSELMRMLIVQMHNWVITGEMKKD